ncbi:carboxy-terminal processing peptidase-like protein [Medicago truncatula]|uniref:C-terminal processing peptidase n=1 Tax=Medicago truncatula TaxID=3880 RepID=A0A072VJD0_MEDTR|nr:carboxy-terminal processing peptidase-like protein [Medicago truncatula]
MMNFDVKARINIPPKVSKPNLVGLFPHRLWLQPTTTWASRKRKVSFEVEEKEVNKVVVVEKIESAAKSAFRFGFSAALSFYIFCHAPTALSQSLTVAFPVSRAPEVNAVQRTLVEAWGLIRETFVDPTFNHQDWDMKLQQTMVEMFPLNSADAAYTKISGMLSTLGDPFTRIISPKEYQGFRIGSDGNLQGVGLFINVEPRTGHLVVLSCIENSPAARAGIHQGDELVEINGERLNGIDSEGAAKRLRGNAGTTVTVKVKDSSTNSYIREVKLPREYIKLSPISSAIIPHRSSEGQVIKTGYVKLSTFSQSAADDMRNAIQEMKNQGVHSYILDLRNNPVIYHFHENFSFTTSLDRCNIEVFSYVFT